MSMTPVLDERTTFTLRKITIQAGAFRQLHELALAERIGHAELAARLLEIALLSGDQPETPGWPLERVRRTAHELAAALQQGPVQPCPDGADADRQAEAAATVQAGYAADETSYAEQVGVVVYPERAE